MRGGARRQSIFWAPTPPGTEHPVDNRGSLFLASIYKNQCLSSLSYSSSYSTLLPSLHHTPFASRRRNIFDSESISLPVLSRTPFGRKEKKKQREGNVVNDFSSFSFSSELRNDRKKTAFEIRSICNARIFRLPSANLPDPLLQTFSTFASNS